MSRKSLTTEEFIKRVKKVHGDKYDYRETEYIHNKINVKIFCNKHQDFFYQSPDNHTNGHGCAFCAGKKRYTTKEFIMKAKEVHDNKYNYSKIKYIDNHTKIAIYCNGCKKYFKQEPHSHLQGYGCSRCSKTYKPTTEEFIKKAKKIHGNKYDYSKVEYKNNETKILIICKKPGHGEFYQNPNNHLRGKKCLKCSIIIVSNKKSLTTEEFIKKAKKIHGNKYDYSKVEYKNSKTKVVIVCKEYGHGIFLQCPSNHLCGQGCPSCKYKNEGKVKKFLLKYFKGWEIIPNKKIWNEFKDYKHKRFCDFWLEKNGTKIIVEYDGELHFEPVSWWARTIKQAKKNLKNYQLKDKLDSEFCKENNIILYRIKYDQDKEKSIKKLLKKVG